MYLKQEKEVTRAALPSLMTSMTQEMSGEELVKGAATEASASEREIPRSAAFKAPQSLAPSPHIPTATKKRKRKSSVRKCDRANHRHCLSNSLYQELGVFQ